MNRVREFLSPAKRKATYAALVAVGGIVQVLGFATDVQVAQWLDVASQVLALAGLLLAVVNTDTTTVNGMPAAEAPGAVAIVQPASPSGAVAGQASVYPVGQPVDVVPTYAASEPSSTPIYDELSPSHDPQA